MKKKILLVEDEKSHQMVIRDELEDDGFEVVTAMTGNEARRKISSESPNLVILDIILPSEEGKDLNEEEGLNIARELKSKSETNNIPIIVITVHGEEWNSTNEAKELCVASFRKPFNTLDLVDKIREILKIKG